MKVKHLSDEATIVVSLWSSSGFFFCPWNVWSDSHFRWQGLGNGTPKWLKQSVFMNIQNVSSGKNNTSRISQRGRFCKNDVRCLVGFFGWMVPHKHWAKYSKVKRPNHQSHVFNVEEVRGNWLQNGLKPYGLENNFYVGNHYLGVTS